MKMHKVKLQDYRNYVGGSLSMCGIHNKVFGWNKSRSWHGVDCLLCLKKKRK